MTEIQLKKHININKEHYALVFDFSDFLILRTFSRFLIIIQLSGPLAKDPFQLFAHPHPKTEQNELSGSISLHFFKIVIFLILERPVRLLG